MFDLRTVRYVVADKLRALNLAINPYAQIADLRLAHEALVDTTAETFTELVQELDRVFGEIGHDVTELEKDSDAFAEDIIGLAISRLQQAEFNNGTEASIKFLAGVLANARAELIALDAKERAAYELSAKLVTASNQLRTVLAVLTEQVYGFVPTKIRKPFERTGDNVNPDNIDARVRKLEGLTPHGTVVNGELIPAPLSTEEIKAAGSKSRAKRLRVQRNPSVAARRTYRPKG